MAMASFGAPLTLGNGEVHRTVANVGPGTTIKGVRPFTNSAP